MKPLLTPLLFMTYIAFSSLTLAEPTAISNETGISENDIRAFCTDKPIWSAFAIDTDTCLTAATHCARQERFKDLDPVQLSEPFYNCTFKELGIEI